MAPVEHCHSKRPSRNPWRSTLVDEGWREHQVDATAFAAGGALALEEAVAEALAVHVG